jgi:cytochrome bd-type quinol oxidase subunit 1
MKKFISIATGVVMAYAVVTSWPELVRYRRMRAM